MLLNTGGFLPQLDGMGDRESSPFRPGLAPGTRATGHFDSRPPSPPTINVPFEPPFEKEDEDGKPLLPNPKAAGPNLHPADEGASPLQLSAREIQIITGNKPQKGGNNPDWAYEQRRGAQAMLDHVWLGPSSSVRDHDTLGKAGITMIVVANEMRSPGQKLKSIDTAADAMGIEVAYVDLEPIYQQVGAFADIIRIINDHALARGRDQPDGEQSHAKILVVCETGNNRAALLVAAYIRAMYATNMFGVIHYMQSRRLSCAFPDDNKRALQAWEDILQARCVVASYHAQAPQQGVVPVAKRGIGDLMDVDMEDEEMDADSMLDRDRFADRAKFAPFQDVPFQDLPSQDVA